MVSHRNVTALVEVMTERYCVSENDVFSQMFDLTFDLSVFDLFVAWERGACVCCPGRKSLINPATFIDRTGLTIWFSVPSTIAFMKQLGLLKPGRFPSLRASLFCGEPLPVEAATAWSQAAPNSLIDNLYGPTELTVACTWYRWDPERSPSEAEQGTVPIGYAVPGMRALVVDDALREVDQGQAGELLMTGPQLSLGYWKDASRTKAAFVVPEGDTEAFYRTGIVCGVPAAPGRSPFLAGSTRKLKSAATGLNSERSRRWCAKRRPWRASLPLAGRPRARAAAVLRSFSKARSKTRANCASRLRSSFRITWFRADCTSLADCRETPMKNLIASPSAACWNKVYEA